MFTATLLATVLLAGPVQPPKPVTVSEAREVVSETAAKVGPQIGHMVYFTLKDNSAAAKDKLVALCDKYLEPRDGVVFYAAGIRGEAFARDVNDKEWDVALHLVFTDKAAHDDYEKHPEHLKFIAAGKDNWTKVRVFDSEIQARPKKK